jgi:hypothetical protein
VLPEELVLHAAPDGAAFVVVVAGGWVAGVLGRVVLPPDGFFVVGVVPPGEPATEVELALGSTVLLVDVVDDDDVDVELLLEDVDEEPSARRA